MNSVSKIGVTLAENNCVPINLEITEVDGPGTTARLDIEGILPSNPLWNTWEWQVNPDWVFNADNSNWSTLQTGGLDFTLGTDDTSVRVKFTIGNCIYYSNVSGMYDHPSYDCPTIELFINPVEPSAHEHPVLHITGLLPSNTGWDTWVWQVAPRFDVNGDEVLTPIWLNAQTGGLEFNAMGDDNIVRVKLQIGNCVYYSNESGYENPIMDNNIYDQSYIIKGDTLISLPTTTTPVKIPFITWSQNTGSSFPQILTGNITNDEFTVATTVPWSMEYTISYNQLSSRSVTYIVDMFKNGVAIGQPIKFTTPSTLDIYTPISRTDEFSINENDVFDFRVSVLAGPGETFKVEDFIVIIKPLFI